MDFGGAAVGVEPAVEGFPGIVDSGGTESTTIRFPRPVFTFVDDSQGSQHRQLMDRGRRWAISGPCLETPRFRALGSATPTVQQ